MGLLTNLVQMKTQQDNQLLTGAITGYKQLLGDPDVTPQAKEYYQNALLKLVDEHFDTTQPGGGAGGKGGKGGTKGAIGKVFGGILNNLTGGLPNEIKRGGQIRNTLAQTGSDQNRPGQPGAPKMFLDDADKARIKKAQEEEQTKILAERGAAVETAKQQADQALETDPKYHNALIEMRKKDLKDAPGAPQPGSPEYNEYVFGIKNTRLTASEEPKLYELKGPNGEKITGLYSPATGAMTVTKRPLPDYTPVIKDPEAAGSGGGDVGRLKEREEILRNLHPDWKPERVKAEASKLEEKYMNTPQANQGMTLTLKQEGIPGSGGTVAPPASGQTPFQSLSPKQKILATDTANMLSAGTSLGFGGAARTRLNEGKRVIEEATGLSPEEIDFRVERRKAAKSTYGKLKVLEASATGLFDSLDRSATILTNLRPQLPNTDVAKINEWLESGAREFNVGGVSEAATRYGLALAAVRNEYARVISGGSASTAQTPVEAIKAANDKIRSGFTIGNTKAMVDQMRTEGQQIIGGRQDELNNLASETRQPLFPELYGKSYEQPQTIAKPQGGGGPAKPARKVGDAVMYQGKQHTITAIDPKTGKLTLSQ